MSSLVASPVKTETGWAIVVVCKPLEPMHNPMNRWLVAKLVRIYGEGFTLHLAD